MFIFLFFSVASDWLQPRFVCYIHILQMPKDIQSDICLKLVFFFFCLNCKPSEAL